MIKRIKSIPKKVIVGISIALAVIILGLGLFFLIRFLSSGTDEEVEIARAEAQYESLQSEYDEDDTKGKGYEFIKKYNDMVGWIRIPKTDFSYPVMQNPPLNSSSSESKGNIDNDDATLTASSVRIQDYYLHKDVHGEYSFYGTPFIDDRCTIFSDNRIIYGHNISGHRYFGYLHYYKEKSFYKKHPRIVYLDEFEKANYEILSVIKCNIHSYVYDFIDLGNKDEHDNALKHIIDDSIYKTTAGKRLKKFLKKWKGSASYPAKLITLSTCRTGEGRDERLLIIAIRSGFDKG